MSVPLNYRVRGDAIQYLSIASKFHSLSNALSYIGDRPNGFPIFEYLFRQQDWNQWTHAICIGIFILHLLASAYLTRTLIRRGWLRDRPIWAWLLFSSLAIYPPMVLHASVPITDTFGSSIMIFALCLLSREKSLLRPALAGALFGYAITVRPAFQAGAVAFLLGFAVLSFRERGKKATIPALAALASCLLYLSPIWLQCYSRYHVFGIQSPATFSPVGSAQAGLKGARVLWFRANLYDRGVSPVLPDSFMRSEFHDRCRLKSMAGLDPTSLTGCLGSRAYLAPVLFAKKLIGFHDAFRLQPYTELMTPKWYPWLARTFASLALWGDLLLFLFAGLSLASRSGARGHLSTLPRDAWTGAVILFVAALLAQHLSLHVEERYSLSWTPYAIAAAVCTASRARELTSRLRYMIGISGAFVLLGYWVQVLAWDAL